MRGVRVKCKVCFKGGIHLTYLKALAKEGPQESRLPCPSRANDLTQENASLGLSLFQVYPLLTGHWEEERTILYI